jgi:hypothetical protein
VTAHRRGMKAIGRTGRPPPTRSGPKTSRCALLPFRLSGYDILFTALTGVGPWLGSQVRLNSVKYRGPGSGLDEVDDDEAEDEK